MTIEKTKQKTTRKPREPAKTTPAPVQKALGLDTPERFRLGELGHNGLSMRMFNGVTTDELKRELNFPNSVRTYKEMTYHSAINASLTLYDTIVSKATWKFTPPEDATEEEKAQTEALNSMLQDMEHSFGDFIRDAMSKNTYGFSVHEKVYRRRFYSNGSKFNDGFVGWKKLPIRSQESIQQFISSDDGQSWIGVKQNLSMLTDSFTRISGNMFASEIVLPRSKVLLFRAGRHRGDPFGKSPLRDAYVSWKFLMAIEELEAIGANKDLSGIPILSLPAQYLSANASADQKEIVAYYETQMRNLQMNEQTAMILPLAYDPETRQPMFKLDLLSQDGKKNFDLSKIKEYYKNAVMTSLFADVLIQGQSTVGSFALGQLKNSLTGAAARVMLQEICDVLNEDLVRQTYELNGWNISRMAKLDFDNLEEADLETLSKAYQRLASTSMIEKDRSVLNAIRSALGVDLYPEDEEPHLELLTPDTSRSGDGMAKGSLNGTSDSFASTDTSSSNLENSA